MTTPSPSEFLTFMRTVARPASACLRQSLARPSFQPSIATRTFAVYPALRATGDAHDKTHATDKADQLDVQSASSAEARAYVLSQYLLGIPCRYPSLLVPDETSTVHSDGHTNVVV